MDQKLKFVSSRNLVWS